MGDATSCASTHSRASIRGAAWAARVRTVDKIICRASATPSISLPLAGFVTNVHLSFQDVRGRKLRPHWFRDPYDAHPFAIAVDIHTRSHRRHHPRREIDHHKITLGIH